ncbi:MAG: G5 domain-containing protein [Bacillota bacterium]
MINHWQTKKLLCLATLSLALLALTVACSPLHYEVFLRLDGEESRPVRASYGTVEQFLRQQGLEIGPKDVVEPGLDLPIAKGMEISVLRAFSVKVAADGVVWELTTTPVPVKEALAELGIQVGANDRVVPSLDELLHPGAQVVVTRVTTKELFENKEIPFRVERRDDPSLEKGIRKVVQEGKKGQERVTIQLTYEDGKEVKREVVNREVVKKPQNQLIAMGTITSASRVGQRFSFKEVRTMEATAYTHTGNKTFTGVYPQVGMVAVDPKVIPLGQRLYVEGYGFAVARDVGSAIKGDRIDVFMETKQEALRWGRKTVKVYVLEE